MPRKMKAIPTCISGFASTKSSFFSSASKPLIGSHSPSLLSYVLSGLLQRDKDSYPPRVLRHSSDGLNFGAAIGLDPSAVARPPALGDLRQVIGELAFFDDEKVIFVGLDQTQVVKPLHEQADSRPRRADHCGEFFMGNF